MDKKELKQDLIRDRLIDYINYIGNNISILLQAVLVIVIIIGFYSFFNIKRIDKINYASQLAGLAQAEYNKEVSDFVMTDLQDVLDDYENTPGGSQAYIYLIYHSYINNDIEKLNRLLDDYSMTFNDPLLKSSLFETNANIAMSNKDYETAIKLLNKALKTNNIYSLKTRFSINKARIYIEKKEYDKAKSLLNNIDDTNVTQQERDVIEELLSYVNHM